MILKSVEDSANDALPNPKSKSKRRKPVTGWNDEVRNTRKQQIFGSVFGSQQENRLTQNFIG